MANYAFYLRMRNSLFCLRGKAAWRVKGGGRQGVQPKNTHTASHRPVSALEVQHLDGIGRPTTGL